MGETTFRATFSADDQSLSSSMRKMRDESHLMANDMIADANKIAQATDQSVNKVLQEQINLYEKGRKATMYQERVALDSSWSAKMASANPQNQSGIKAQWDAAKKDLNEQFKRDDIQIDLLRDIVSAINGNAIHGINSKQSKDNINKVRSGSTDGMTPEAEYQARVQYGLSGKDDNKAGSISSIAIGTMLGQMLFSGMRGINNIASGAISASDGEIATSKFWSAVPFVGDALSNASSRHIELAEKRDRLALGINSRGGNVNILQDSDVFGLDDAIAQDRNIDGTPMTDEDRQRNLDGLADIDMITNPRQTRGMAEHSAKKTMADLHNEAVSNINKRKSVGDWSYESAGLDSTEFLEMAGRLLPELGSSSNLLGQTKAFADITRGGGIGEGNALGVANLMRLNGGGDLRSVMGSIVGNLGGGTSRALRDKHVADVISMSQSRYGEGFANVDPSVMARVSGAFKNNFGEALSSSDNIMSMMASVSKPSDEFQQGINYKIYAEQMSKQGKSASYIGFKQWQEKPENGLLSGKMDYIKNVYGTGEFGIMAANAAGIGKTWEANELYLKGGTKGLRPEDMAKANKTVGFNAEDYTTSRQIQQAQLTDAFTKSMWDGIGKALEQVATAMEKQASATFKLLEHMMHSN